MKKKKYWIDYDDGELKNELITNYYLKENKNNIYIYNSLNNPINFFIIANNFIENKNKFNSTLLI